ncbi:OB-fold protein [Paraburkholderia agricolaris]|uniref:OB-fold protein n=1 Tax=Paraburkholderia agricolaris TaxID=2152888 RepID=UPI0012909AF2|nr:hypothetical protein [Paraburkholderia agricolaris]
MRKLFKWIGIICGGLVALVILVGVFAPKQSATETSTGASNANAREQSATATSAAVPVAPINVATGVLFDDYDSNEVAADQKYKGKALAIAGTVQSIDKDAFDNIVVALRTKNEFMPVHAYLDKEHESLAASLRKGQKIAWVCVGAGKIIGSPIIRDCNPRT